MKNPKDLMKESIAAAVMTILNAAFDKETHAIIKIDSEKFSMELEFDIESGYTRLGMGGDPEDEDAVNLAAQVRDDFENACYAAGGMEVGEQEISPLLQILKDQLTGLIRQEPEREDDNEEDIPPEFKDFLANLGL